MNNNKPLITLPDGSQATDLTPNLKGKLAIVNISVIVRLAKHLSHASFQQIQNELQAAIQKTKQLDEMVDMLEDEIAFHKTVNLLKTFESEPA